MEKVDLTKVIPADYNPRFLSEKSRERLVRSLTELGCIKPIIVNKKNNTIIAGHQRTSTMLSMGIKECYGFVLDGLTTTDEIRFNQLHNRCEYEVNDNAPKIHIKSELVEGVNRISCDDVVVVDIGNLPTLNNMLCRLISTYGEFGMPISNLNGEILVSSAYAYASKLMRKDLYVYAVGKDKEKAVREYFSVNYGVFNYDNLKKNTYIQGLAQMKRLRRVGRKKNHSTLYEKVVIPYISKDKNLRILDFGAGQFDYANMLKAKGYDIIAIDPYHFIEKTAQVDYSGNVKRYEKVISDIQEKGLYDVVICDCVLNSVDSMKAEQSVILSCKALCKNGGKVFMSGRKREEIEKDNIAHRGIMEAKYIRFFDENGFTAIYRNGEWFYQKFHDKKGRENICKILGGGVEKCYHDRKATFIIEYDKNDNGNIKDNIDALRFEFSLILPNGKKYELADKIEKAYENRLPDN